MQSQVRQPIRQTEEAAPASPSSAPLSPSRKIAALRPVNRWLPAGAPAVEAGELWVGVHLEDAGSRDGGDGERGADARGGAVAPEVLLERLATRAQRFTPRVSLAPPDGLLLEVKGSLHLFNGVEGLGRALSNECALLGLKTTLAVSPTPLSALVAARAGGIAQSGAAQVRARPTVPAKMFVVLSLQQLVGRLAAIPVTALRWPEDSIERLAHMGVRTIGEVLRLPRAGFAKRFGTEHLSTLDRLVGRTADLRDRFHARERFRRKRDLTYELESHDGIVSSLEPLFKELGAFLLARQCGVLVLECRLRHRQASTSSCVLRLAAPSFDAERLSELMSERLNALVLPEPVRSCELRSGALVRSVFASSSLWQPGEHGGNAGTEAPELIEYLRARLGPEAVYGLKVLQGHRPENAWGAREPRATSIGARGATTRTAVAEAARAGAAPHATSPWPAFRRPHWLLPSPKLLRERDGLPRYRGPLRLVSDPERIETGWWDGGEVARDYYVALTMHGVRLWIFRERNKPHRWFLHGVFA
jgi:protein ImuB